MSVKTISVLTQDVIDDIMRKIEKDQHVVFGTGSFPIPSKRELEEFAFKWNSDYGPRGVMSFQDFESDTMRLVFKDGKPVNVESFDTIRERTLTNFRGLV